MNTLHILFVAFALLFTPLDSGTEWMTDMTAAQKEASSNDRMILLNFSGSDWCGNCMRLDRTLFETDDFAAFAKANLVLLRADFPMKKKNALSAEQTKANEALAEKYNPSGAFPKMVLIDSDGKVVADIPANSSTAAEYLELFKKHVK